MGFNNKSDTNKRAQPRLKIACSVKIDWPGHKTDIFKIRDMSHTGLFIECEEKPIPPVDSIVYVQLIQGDISDLPIVKSRVARATHDGFAIHFIEDE